MVGRKLYELEFCTYHRGPSSLSHLIWKMGRCLLCSWAILQMKEDSPCRGSSAFCVGWFLAPSWPAWHRPSAVRIVQPGAQRLILCGFRQGNIKVWRGVCFGMGQRVQLIQASVSCRPMGLCGSPPWTILLASLKLWLDVTSYSIVMSARVSVFGLECCL